MTTASALHALNWHKLRLSKSEFQRMLFAGAAWGIIMSAGIAAMTWHNHGMICVDHVVMTGVISIVTGILAIGPIAAYGRR